MATKKVGDWTVTAAMSLILRKGSKVLYVGVTQSPNDTGKWVVLALEAAAKDNMQGVLSSHAHDLVGVFPFVEAIRRAEDYARGWRPSSRKCPCDEIRRTPATVPARLAVEEPPTTVTIGPGHDASQLMRPKAHDMRRRGNRSRVG